MSSYLTVYKEKQVEYNKGTVVWSGGRIRGGGTPGMIKNLSFPEVVCPRSVFLPLISD